MDERAVVYVNGRTAGQYGLPGQTWRDRFEIDVTAYLKPGEKDLIVVQDGRASSRRLLSFARTPPRRS